MIDSSIDPGLYDVNEYEDKVYLEVIDVEFKLPIIKKQCAIRTPCVRTLVNYVTIILTMQY